MDAPQPPAGVHRDLPGTPLDLLAAMESPRLLLAMGLNALGIHQQIAWRGGPSFLASAGLVDQPVDLRPHPSPVHPPEMIVDGLVGREIFGQLRPLAARLDNVEHRVDDRTPRVPILRPARIRPRHQRFDQQPLLIAQIRRIPPSLAPLAPPKDQALF